MKNGNVSKFENETSYLDCPKSVSGRLQQQVEQAGIAPVNIQPCKLLKNADIYPNGTSHQIRRHADRLLPPSVRDVDQIDEDRTGVISVLEGVPPVVKLAASQDEEAALVSEWITKVRAKGVLAEEIGVFVRSMKEIKRAERDVVGAREEHRQLLVTSAGPQKGVSIGTMHRAKGLEFRAVAVIACDDEVIFLAFGCERVGR